MQHLIKNGKKIEMSAEEVATLQAEAEQAEKEYWATIDYDEAVNNKIRTPRSFA